MSPLTLGTEAPTAWIFAFWILTIALAAPLLLGTVLRSRWSSAQRTVVRGVLLLAPAILVAGLLLPDPFGGRPLLRLSSADLSSGELPAPRENLPIEFDELDGLPLVGVPNDAPGSPPEHVDPSIGLAGLQWRIAEANDAVRADLEEEQLSEVRLAFETGTAVVPRDPEWPARGPMDPEQGSTLEFPAMEISEPPTATPSLLPREVPRAPVLRELARTSASPPPADLISIQHPTALRAPSSNAPGRNDPWEPRRAAVDTSPIGGEGASGFSLLDTLVAAFVFVWAIGVIIGWLRIAGSAYLLTRWRRTSNTLGSTRGVPNIDPSATPLPVRIIPGLGTAAAVGVLSPEIWLPAHWSARLDRGSLHALLGHEAAHHNGRDPLWRLLGAFVVAILWPHPLVHSLRRREEHLSELEADRLVIAGGAGPRRYAELLANLAAEATRSPSPLAAGVLGTRSPLERRIRMILSTTPSRSRRSAGWAAPAVLGAVCAAAIGLSACFPLVGNACDPEEKAASKVEFVLDRIDGQWVAVATKGDGKPSWKLPFAEVSDGEAHLDSRDGRYARVSLGARTLLFDTESGRMIEAPRAGLSLGHGSSLGHSEKDPFQSLFFDADDRDSDDGDDGDHRVHLRDRLAGDLEEREAQLLALETALHRMQMEFEQQLLGEESSVHQQLGDLSIESSAEIRHLADLLAAVSQERSALGNLDEPARDKARRKLAKSDAKLARAKADLEETLEMQIADLIEHAEHLKHEGHSNHEAHSEHAGSEALEQALELLENRLENSLAGQRSFEQALAQGAEQRDRQLSLRLSDEDSQALRDVLGRLEATLARGGDHLNGLPGVLDDVQVAISGLERGVDSIESSVERAVDRLPEILAGLEELPAILESLAHRHEDRGDDQRLREQLEDARDALIDERNRRQEVEEENRVLRRKLESLKKRERVVDTRPAGSER